MSNFAVSGDELAAVKQRLDYQAMSGFGTYEEANGATEVVSATLMYPSGGELTELSATDRYRFGGKELDTHGGLFHYDFAARWYDPVFPAFTTVDPMAEDNVHVSPYSYCHGNPVMFIDPTGEDEYFINPNGKITKINKTKEFDKIVLVDDKGNIRKNENGDELSLQYKYKTLDVKSNKSFYGGNKRYGYDVITVKGDEKGTEIFEFLSEFITIDSEREIGQIKTGNSELGKNYIITNHDRAESVQSEYYSRFLYNVTTRELIHSHPLGYNASEDDKNTAYEVVLKAKKFNKRLPQFFIYHAPSGEYLKYKPQKKFNYKYGKRK